MSLAERSHTGTHCGIRPLRWATTSKAIHGACWDADARSCSIGHCYGYEPSCPPEVIEVGLKALGEEIVAVLSEVAS